MTRSKVRDPRRSSAARLAATQGLYEIEVTGASPNTILLDFIEKRWQAPGIYDNEDDKIVELSEPDKNKFSQIINGVQENLKQIHNILSAALANDREMQHLDVLLRTVLRAGVLSYFSLLRFLIV